MAEKTMPLRTEQDASAWVEKIANEVTQDPHGIAQNNVRLGCVKAMFGGKKLRLDYEKFAHKFGGRINDLQKFFAT